MSKRSASRRNVLASMLAFGFLVLSAACSRPEPLTAAKAEQILKSHQFEREPVYAEVPQRVWWSPQSPQDDYDGKALLTLRNLERAGFLTVTHSIEGPGSESYVGHVTEKGFPLIGTAPSARGPCFRAAICTKRYDGMRNFVRHPTDPLIGHAELVWHYENPTPMYPLFETKVNKPIGRPFATYVSFYYKDYQWKFDVTVPKTEANGF